MTLLPVLRLFRQAFWLRALLFVVVLSAAFVALGRWQYGRHLTKSHRAEVIEHNYDAAPVALSDLLTDPSAALPDALQWRSVRLTGRYLADRAWIVRNRPLGSVNPQYGYEVLVPLELTGGRVLYVDRGWLPPGEGFVKPDSAPAPPAGQVTVVARLRAGEPSADRPPPAGQQLRIDLARMAAGLPETVGRGSVYRTVYGLLGSETPAPAAAPQSLPAPDTDLGPHLSYAVQWWSGALAAWLVLGYYAAREARDGAPLAPTGRPRLDRRPTDEEIEDALTG